MSADGRRGRAADRLLARAMRVAAGWMIALAVMALAGAVAETVLPAVLGRAVDGALAGGAGAWSSLAAWIVACAALVAVIVAADAFAPLATGASSANATAWLRRLLCRHVLSAGPQATRRFQTGDIVSRLTAGAAEAGHAPAAAVMALASLVPAVGAPVALVLIDPWLAVAFGAGLPLLAIVLRTFVRDTSRVVARYQRAQGAIAARLLDALGGVRTIAAAGALAQESDRVLGPLPELGASGRATWRAVGRISAQGTLLVPLLQVLVLGVGGVELAAGRITPGELLAASQYAVLGSGVGVMITHLGRLARARAGAVRSDEVLSIAVMTDGGQPVPVGPGRLELRGVTVRLENETVFGPIDLVVPPGTVVAIVGRSGAGKSLMAALAGRLLDPDRGEALLDGVPLPRIGRHELRCAVRYAFERPALLGDTVRDAIRFGVAPPSPRHVIDGARAACADAFIRRLPGGYDTPLATTPLSGGEAQRIGLARAFAHAGWARLLILDDATSSLDTVTEMQVSDALIEQFAGRTRMIVAHRPGTAARADLVAWLVGGRLRACAPHGELWADPEYRAAFAAEEPSERAG